MLDPQNVPKLYFWSQFCMSKTNRFFLFKNINLGDHFLVKTLFSRFNFQPLYFLKLCPIFDELTFPCRILLKKVSLVDPWPKILLFRTHHLWNSTTELILMLLLWFFFCSFLTDLINLDPRWFHCFKVLRILYVDVRLHINSKQCLDELGTRIY